MKRILSMMLTIITVVTLLAACKNSYTVNLISNDFTVNLGDAVSTDISDYVRASKSMLSEMKLDVSGVSTNKEGSYKAYIEYSGDKIEFTIKVADVAGPQISLKNKVLYFENSATITPDDIVANVTDMSDYEYGFSDDMTLADNDKTIVQTKEYSAIGEYHDEIIARDKAGNTSVAGFTVNIVETGNIPVDALNISDFHPYMNNNRDTQNINLNDCSTNGVYYGVGTTVDSETNRPDLNYYQDLYGKYAVDFIQPNSSFVWLTFNEIAEQGNTSLILDTLKEKNVSAVFFVTLSYVQNNPEIIKRMLDEGHVIGNYSASCVKAPELSVNGLTSEIDKLYNYVYNTYGYEMYLFRNPSGYFSEQTLAVAEKLGYRTVFWSYAYADWDVNNQPDLDESLQKAVNSVHGGAIYLLSGASKTNQMMLADLIDEIRDKGYEFGIYQK